MRRINGIEDPPYCGIYADLAKVISEDDVNIIYEYFRGQQINFPMHLYTIDYVARIATESENPVNVKDLAREYGYSERHIHRIVKQLSEQKEKS